MASTSPVALASNSNFVDSPAPSWQYEFVGDEIGNLALRLLRAFPRGRPLIAIDGVDGSGKTTFASALSARLGPRPSVVIHADDFLLPSETRYARGRHSPEGFWHDTYDYPALRGMVLDPLGPGGTGVFYPKAFDHVRNVSLTCPPVVAQTDAFILVEGMFLHRAELDGLWQYSIFLDVPFSETARRLALRDGPPESRDEPSEARYIEGQKIYFNECRPWAKASLVLDNSAHHEPRQVPTSHIGSGPY